MYTYENAVFEKTMAYYIMKLSVNGREPETLPARHTHTGNLGLHETIPLKAFHVTSAVGAFEVWARKYKDRGWTSTNTIYKIISNDKVTQKVYQEALEKLKLPYDSNAIRNCTRCNRDLKGLPLTYTVRGQKVAYCSRECRGDQPLPKNKKSGPDLREPVDLKKGLKTAAEISKEPKGEVASAAKSPAKSPAAARPPKEGELANPPKLSSFPVTTMIYKVKDEAKWYRRLTSGSRRRVTFDAFPDSFAIKDYKGDPSDLWNMLKGNQVSLKPDGGK